MDSLKTMVACLLGITLGALLGLKIFYNIIQGFLK